jgi:hypothetical protein
MGRDTIRASAGTCSMGFARSVALCRIFNSEFVKSQRVASRVSMVADDGQALTRPGERPLFQDRKSKAVRSPVPHSVGPSPRY